MKKSPVIELCPMWDRGEGRLRSAILMDDRLTELIQMAKEGPVMLFLKPNENPKSINSPNAFLLAVRPGKS
ncbi:MAG: hypothetical protein ACLQPD_00355 [Desulfomonilaceae bacterium]